MRSKAIITSRGKTISIFIVVAVSALIFFGSAFFIIKIFFFSSPYSISGNITKADGTPLEGIKVFAQNIDVERAIYSTVSDGKGSYRIKLDKEGNYYIWTDNQNGYVDIFYDNKLFYREPDTVKISDSEYYDFCRRAQFLKENIKKNFGKNLNPRQLDKFLLRINDKIRKIK